MGFDQDWFHKHEPKKMGAIIEMELADEHHEIGVLNTASTLVAGTSLPEIFGPEFSYEGQLRRSSASSDDLEKGRSTTSSPCADCEEDEEDDALRRDFGIATVVGVILIVLLGASGLGIGFFLLSSQRSWAQDVPTPTGVKDSSPSPTGFLSPSTAEEPQSGAPQASSHTTPPSAAPVGRSSPSSEAEGPQLPASPAGAPVSSTSSTSNHPTSPPVAVTARPASTSVVISSPIASPPTSSETGSRPGQLWRRLSAGLVEERQLAQDCLTIEDPTKILRCVEKLVSDRLKRDRAFMLDAVRLNGLALQYAQGGLTEDRELCLAAIENNGLALQYASEDLTKDEGFSLAAIEKSPRAIRFAHHSLLLIHDPTTHNPTTRGVEPNRHFSLQAVLRNPEALRFVDGTLKKDREFLLRAIWANPLVLLFVDGELKNDINFIRSAVAENPMAERFVTRGLEEGTTLNLQAVDGIGQALKELGAEKFRPDAQIGIRAVDHSSVPPRERVFGVGQAREDRHDFLVRKRKSANK